MKRMSQWMLAAILVCGATVLTACSNSDNSAQGVKGGADLVVYGKIFTSERLYFLKDRTKQKLIFY
jgi:predicted small secreted protein